MSVCIARENAKSVDKNPQSRSRRVLTALKNSLAGIFNGSPCNPARSAPEVQSLEPHQLLSGTLFVAPYGSDANNGTINSPFKTIQHAASIATAGTTVEIRAGVYHETVTPSHSGTSGAPITFAAYNGENVTVSGADPVTGWSSYKGAIYDASMPWDLGEGNNEVFVGSTALNEARFPNAALNSYSHPTLETISSISGPTSKTIIKDPSLSQPAGSWVGAIVHITPGQAWTARPASSPHPRREASRSAINTTASTPIWQRERRSFSPEKWSD